jgi:hypothetical protein
MPNWAKAVEQAKANAKLFGVPYQVFYDASGVANCERVAGTVLEGALVILPNTSEIKRNPLCRPEQFQKGETDARDAT